MFAIVRTGGKQYRVVADDQIVVDRIEGDVGARVDLASLAIGGDAVASVAAEIVAHTQGDKIIIFKKKRRHNYRRRNGHRQLHTVLRIVAVGAETEADHGA